MDNPLIAADVRRLQDEREARLNKRAKLIEEQKERERKSREADARADAEKIARMHPQPDTPRLDIPAFAVEQRKKIKAWDDEKRLANMRHIKERFFRLRRHLSTVGLFS